MFEYYQNYGLFSFGRERVRGRGLLGRHEVKHYYGPNHGIVINRHHGRFRNYKYIDIY